MFRPCDAQQNTHSKIQKVSGNGEGRWGKGEAAYPARRKEGMGCNRSRSDGGGGGGGGTRRGGGQKWPALVQHAWRNAHRLSENERGKGMGGRISYCGQGDGDSRWLGRRWRQRLKAAAAAAVKSWDANHTKSMKRNKRGKRERVSGRGGNGPAIKDNSRQERQQTTVVTAYGGGQRQSGSYILPTPLGLPVVVPFSCV